MASIDEGGGGGHKQGPGVKKAKKLSTRVDMTPMVDLGFLLITFFIFTATMSSPTTLDLNMPKDVKDPKEQTEVKQSGVLSIMMGKGNQVYYYEGQLEVSAEKNNFKTSNYKDIRKVILDKKNEVVSKHVHKDEICIPEREAAKESARKRGVENPNWQDACKDVDFVVILKPNAEATYKNTVDMLDEMTINQVKRYAMVKVLDVENELIKKTEQTNGVK
jgi:biopolymer transport protein ExbD